MPFYDGDPNDDVITIFESSYCFQGFIAQGSSKIYKKKNMITISSLQTIAY